MSIVVGLPYDVQAFARYTYDSGIVIDWSVDEPRLNACWDGRDGPTCCHRGVQIGVKGGPASLKPYMCQDLRRQNDFTRHVGS